MLNRRRFLAASAAALAVGHPRTTLAASDAISGKSGVKLKLGLNAYSFNAPLQSGAMTLADAIAFCAENGVDALDATGYYFPAIRRSRPTTISTLSSAQHSSTASPSAAPAFATTSPPPTSPRANAMCRW